MNKQDNKMAEKIKVAVVGYGNIGKAAIEALNVAPDMELVGVVRRSVSGAQPSELANVKVVDDIDKLGKVDVALLCTPTRAVPETAKSILAKGIATVDSFDIHTRVVGLRKELGEVAKKYNTAAIISAGWDPGSDSMIRAIMEAMAPRGLTYTNFGPGRSMGHTVCAKSKEGVRDALSMTIPLGTGIHRRMVYVELEPGHKLEDVARAIKEDDYFAHDETHVIEVPSVDALNNVGHGVDLIRNGVSGTTANQNLRFEMKINNPSLTGQVMVSCARAVLRQQPGCYTMIEIAPVDLLVGEREALVGRLV